MLLFQNLNFNFVFIICFFKCFLHCLFLAFISLWKKESIYLLTCLLKISKHPGAPNYLLHSHLKLPIANQLPQPDALTHPNPWLASCFRNCYQSNVHLSQKIWKSGKMLIAEKQRSGKMYKERNYWEGRLSTIPNLLHQVLRKFIWKECSEH